MGSKLKLDSKTTVILAVAGVIVLVAVFIYISIALKPAPAPETAQPVVTKNQSKTYVKYVALNEDKTASGSPTIAPLATVTAAPSSSPTPTTVSKSSTSSANLTTTVTTTPEPTEIVIAQVSPTISGGQTTLTPTFSVVTLPTTGNLTGGMAIFAVSLSMIIFAFVF